VSFILKSYSNFYFDCRVILLPGLPLGSEGKIYGTEKVRQIRTFYLQKKHTINDRVISKIISIPMRCYENYNFNN